MDVLQASAGAMRQLKLLLEDTPVTKVVHDYKQDAAALLNQQGIEMQTGFDTQVCQCNCSSILIPIAPYLIFALTQKAS